MYIRFRGEVIFIRRNDSMPKTQTSENDDWSVEKQLFSVQRAVKWKSSAQPDTEIYTTVILYHKT